MLHITGIFYALALTINLPHLNEKTRLQPQFTPKQCILCDKLAAKDVTVSYKCSTVLFFKLLSLRLFFCFIKV